MRVRFWGVRGSLPTPGRSTVRYGGNTPCVEVRLGERQLILDAGSGLRGLSAATAREQGPVRTDLLLSHVHYDHICGLPFFAPLFRPDNDIDIWAPHLADGSPARTVLCGAMSPPLMPDLLPLISARVVFHDFEAGSALDLGSGAKARTARLQHPGGSIAYRIEWEGQVLVYATDTGHGDPVLDEALRGLCQGAGLLIYDAMLTDAEFPDRESWGHSTWREGVRLAEECRVGKLILFHHAPDRDDKAVAALAAEAASLRPGTVAAREGLRVKVPKGR